MTQTLLRQPAANSLTSPRSAGFNVCNVRHRIQQLTHDYLAPAQLNAHLNDLPQQFQHPHPRPWQTIDWHAVTPEQVIDIQLPTFLAVLKGAIDTEAPIRGYTQTSRQYLESLHPQLARFVGGTVDVQGQLLELGLWEKEERQHMPALLKIYTLLSDHKLTPQPHQVRPYQPSTTARTDLYRHGLHRVLTEYGATCLYLWLMAHTTGSLQQIMAELVRDEINHMTKFWGFGVWAYPETSLWYASASLLQSMRGNVKYSREYSSLVGTLDRMQTVLGWSTWSWQNRMTFLSTCTSTMQHLWRWHHTLTPEHLQALFGVPPQSSSRAI
jgi:hypothetical protein